MESTSNKIEVLLAGTKSAKENFVYMMANNTDRKTVFENCVVNFRYDIPISEANLIVYCFKYRRNNCQKIVDDIMSFLRHIGPISIPVIFYQEDYGRSDYGRLDYCIKNLICKRINNAMMYKFQINFIIASNDTLDKFNESRIEFWKLFDSLLPDLELDSVSQIAKQIDVENIIGNKVKQSITQYMSGPHILIRNLGGHILSICLCALLLPLLFITMYLVHDDFIFAAYSIFYTMIFIAIFSFCYYRLYYYLCGYPYMYVQYYDDGIIYVYGKVYSSRFKFRANYMTNDQKIIRTMV